MEDNYSQGSILIVDDSRESALLLATILDNQKYQVRSIYDGASAVVAAGLDPPDLILLDINMPDMDGYEVCQRLKDQPQTHDVPVIFISALDEVVDKLQAFTAGGCDYITKPYEAGEVLARVENQLKLHRLQLKLEQEVVERKEAEARVRNLNAQLEQRVLERTAQLEQRDYRASPNPGGTAACSITRQFNRTAESCFVPTAYQSSFRA